MSTNTSRQPLLAAGTLLGIGMGGFADGIVFHQILQLHAMLSNRLPKDSIANIEINMFWDGLFHAFCWIMVALGLGLLFRALRSGARLRSGPRCLGALLLGWGIFNVVEGVIDHQVLQLHHVYQGGRHLLWDLVFLASGVALIGAGWVLLSGQRPGRAPGSPSSI